MKAVRNTERGVQVVDVAPSAPPAAFSVRIAVRSAGICSGDLRIVAQGPHPRTLGHEIAGVCDDGRAVAVEPHVTCGECDQCAQGDYNRCRLGPAHIIGYAFDGGMAEELWVPAHCIAVLPPGLNVWDACLVEPLAVALHAVRRGGIAMGQRIAVVGGGTIGQLCVAAARALGANVALKARHKVQIEVGARLGAVNTDNREYDVVLDCAGTQSALDEGCKLLRPGGTLVLLGIYRDPVRLPSMDLLAKEIRGVPSLMSSVHAGVRDVEAAAGLLAAHPEIPKAVITHRFPLADAREAFRVARDHSGGAIKVVFELGDARN
jgi:2-desacetyl-2-hydroxyethyl bacteriochlorophyllide A dehydrogenase